MFLYLVGLIKVGEVVEPWSEGSGGAAELTKKLLVDLERLNLSATISSSNIVHMPMHSSTIRQLDNMR